MQDLDGTDQVFKYYGDLKEKDATRARRAGAQQHKKKT
jgi:hypothetical protein